MLITIPIWVLNMIGKKIDRARHTQPFLFSVYLKLFYGTSTQGTRDKGQAVAQGTREKIYIDLST